MMKRLYRILGILLVVLVVLVGLVMLAVSHISRRALPDYNKSITLQGLKGEVQVLRDERAVPHVFADNTHDLYMVTGYLMAQDRLWQMDLLRRATMGSLAEIFGADMVDADHLLRALRMTEKSKMVMDSLSPDMLSELEAFSSGVNQYIAQTGNRLPPEFTILGYKPVPWEPIHTVNLIGYMAWDLVGSWQNEIALYKLRELLPEEKWLQLFPEIDNQQTFVYPEVQTLSLLEAGKKLEDMGLEIRNGSNNWAVSGTRTVSGKAMMANDMHLGFGLPGIWYQIRQTVKGKFSVSGVSLPGAPAVICGHNDHIAWGMTNLYVDEMDFYAETINPEGTHYSFNGNWLPLEIRSEKIAVKGGDTVVRTIAFTHRGPIISGFKKMEGEQISMRWTGNDYSNELRTIMLLNRATNWDEFRDAVKTFGAVAQNIVYADVEGNIGLQVTGNIPIRRSGNAIFVYPGDTDTYDWTGSVPFSELPFEFNPPRGYVSSANNRTAGPDYPHYIGYWYDNSARIDRIRQMIEATDKHDTESFMNMHLDQTTAFAPPFVERIIPIIKNSGDLSPKTFEAISLLENWDYSMPANAPQPAIFEGFYRHFMANVLKDELGDKFADIGGGLMRHIFSQLFDNPQSSLIDDTRTTEVEDFETIVVRSFEDAIAELSDKLGTKPANWKWGDIHQLTLNHPMGRVKVLDRLFGLNKGPYPVGGSFHTVNPMAYNFHKGYAVNHGASQRHIYNTGDWSQSYTVIPTGTSGIPASRYYAAQRNMFLKGEYYREPWNREEVEAVAKYKAVFSPQ
ncbi:MAG TPA: penicillin acylase family protein [Bacteroidales bacterium]|nr:penicillin acylase family protein [Bacteroidales bacterium]